MGTLQEALAKLIRNREPVDERARKAKEGAAAAAKALPEGMFPHDALRRKRERMKRLDEETKE